MAKFTNVFKQLMEILRNIRKNDTFNKTLILIFLFLGLLAIFILGAAPEKYNLSVGEISSDDIYAPSDIVDKATTDQRKIEAEQSVQSAYKQDYTVQIELSQKIENFFGLIRTLKKDENLNYNQRLENMKQQANISLSEDKYAALLKASDSALDKLYTNVNYILNQILAQNFTEQQLEEKRSTIKDFFANITEESSLNEIGSDIAVIVIKPNMFIDEATTLARKEEARNSVEDVIIKRGTRIVNKGQEVTAQQIQLLEDYGLLDNGTHEYNLETYASYSIIIIVSLFILCLNLYKYDFRIWHNNSSLFLISLIILIAMISAVSIRAISDHLIIIPAFVMIISIMLNPRIAIITNVIIAILIGCITGYDVSVLIIVLLAGIIGPLMVHKTYHRSTIVFTGLVISLITALLITSFGIINHLGLKDILIDIVYGIIGGILSSVLTIGILPFLESVFDIITPIKLLELSNPNQPLLRRLLIEAPGTYYHSILVGNLSEAAAEEVEANALLCRIGAYYHDIGKLKRPYFFKENQITKENPHDKITPNLSALIITSHVKDGIELAKKYKLPSSVVSIIRQHHGDTLVAYFYHKALNSENGGQISEDKFRYPFIKPQTKEAAIVMLADSVEAYIRSLVEPTQEQVEQGVKKIVRDKLQDGQLEQCELTLKDLDKIGKAFVKVLAGIFHDRIEYPETIKDI